MKILVVYDSLYGNTEKIAEAIGAAFSGEARVLRASAATPADLEGTDLLIVGAPTQGGRAAKPMQAFLKNIPASAIKGTSVAAFDTRSVTKWVGIFGYAAGRIANSLTKMGGNLVADPEGFFVTGTQGPLKDGETERAATWAKSLVK